MILNSLRLFGQILILFTIIIFGGNLIYMKIPGYGESCDAEQFYLVLNWSIFLLLSLFFSINTVIFYRIKHLKLFRIFSLFIVFTLFLSLFTIRPIYSFILFGQESMYLKSKKDGWLYIKLKLYDNGTFFSDIYDLSCSEEIIGQYSIKNDMIYLTSKKKSEYLGSRLQIVENNVNVLGSDIVLKKEN